MQLLHCRSDGESLHRLRFCATTRRQPGMAATELDQLLGEIRGCRVCAAQLGHEPRPVVQAAASARLLIVGQAPGSKVRARGIPWDDDSGERLRDWTGLSRDTFYNAQRVAMMPMGFCYPGKGTSGDLPPRPECAPLWHARLLAALPGLRLTLLVGQYAIACYLFARPKVSLAVAVRKRAAAPPGMLPLPHPA